MQSLFEYGNYADFLKDWISNQPRNGRGILKKWSELLRIEPSVLSQIMNKKRSLNLDQAMELSEHLSLSGLESKYLFLLVELEGARTYKLRNHLNKELLILKEKSLLLQNRIKHDKNLSSDESAIFYSSWIYPAARLATSIGKGQDADSLAALLGISREMTVLVLSFLKETGLVTEELGRFKMTRETTFLNKFSPFINKHHSTWRVKALQRAELLTDEELMFTAPLSISEKDFASLREEIVKLITKVGKVAQDSEAERVALFQIDFIYIK